MRRGKEHTPDRTDATPATQAQSSSTRRNVAGVKRGEGQQAQTSTAQTGTPTTPTVPTVAGIAGLQTPVRVVRLTRRANGTFGIALHEISIPISSGDSQSSPQFVQYICVEPSEDTPTPGAPSTPNTPSTPGTPSASTPLSNTPVGLLPGDVLLAVNSRPVERLSREQVVRLVQQTAGDVLVLQVQALPEMFEINKFTVARAATPAERRKSMASVKPWACLDGAYSTGHRG